jgi:xanthine dehydrogenase YagT iron-sulfur-binding subunit
MKPKKTRRTKPKAEEQALSRREFLRGAGVAVSGGLLTGEGLLKAAGKESQGKVMGPDAVSFTLRINGKTQAVTLEPRVTLLDALRNHLDITGSKRVCDRGTCGACTVMVDGRAAYACSMLAIEAEGRNVTTIEGLAAAELHPIVQAFVNHDAQQCGFCTPGFVMATAAFLSQNPHPALADVERGLGGNICRCGTYHGLKQAALEAAQSMKPRS